MAVSERGAVATGSSANFNSRQCGRAIMLQYHLIRSLPLPVLTRCSFIRSAFRSKLRAVMETLECPKCGAPVSCDANFATSARCAYCHSQIALPNEMRPTPIVMPQIDITIGPQVARTASRALWFILLIPVIIIVIVFAGVFGAISQVRRALSPLAGLR